MFASVLGGCRIEDPAKEDVERLLETLCEQTETCRCAGAQDMNACEVRRNTWEARLSFGRDAGLVYDAECVASMQTRIAARSCLDATTDEGGHLCDDYCAVFHGDVALGEPCKSYDPVTSDCVQGATCLDGTCTPPCGALAGLPSGSRCRDPDGAEFDDCAENLVCDWNSNRCVSRPGIGEPCPSGDCARDAYCDWNANVCRARADVGERCGEIDCVQGAYCEWGQSDGICRADRTLGQSCRESRCAAGLLCDYDRDACVPPAGEGQPCESIPCADDLWCDRNIGRCAALPDGEGQPCPAGECAGRLWCDTANDPSGECRLRAPFGDPCTGHRQCETGFCPAGFCEDLPLEGDSCASANACANGLVCDGQICVTALNRGSAVCSFAGW